MTGPSHAARPRPLEDVRVLAVEQFGAGPYGSLILADLGAHVIKVEDPVSRGDIGRYVPPFQAEDSSLFFETFNRGKQSIALDLRQPSGRDVLERLVRVSDAVYSNLRGDVVEKLRLRYADLAPINRRIVCCSLSGFGQHGPRRSEPAYDHVLQALCGWMSLTGDSAAPPTRAGISLVDFAGGLSAAVSLVAAIHAARRDGEGTDCDVSLFDVGIGLLTYIATWQLTEGYQIGRQDRSAHPSLVPFQSFKCSDGWIVVCCPKEKFWRLLVKALGREELLEDERFDGFEARLENSGPLLGILNSIFATEPTAHWVDQLGGIGVPVARVNSVEEALQDSQFTARGLVVDTHHPILGPVRSVATPPRVGDRPSTYDPAPPMAGDRNEILTNLLGLSEDESRDLESRGAFGRVPLPGTAVIAR